MYTLLVILFLIISFLMVIVILMQSSKGGGLASSFGGLGGGAFLGARGTADFLQKATMVLGISYGVVIMLIGIYIAANSSPATQKSEAEQMFEKVQSIPSAVAPAPFDVKNAKPVAPEEGSQNNQQGQQPEPKNK